jgi:hypothetical protein
MFDDVIQALSASRALAGIAVVTVDPTASAIALRRFPILREWRLSRC